jgi:hypothetical protein
MNKKKERKLLMDILKTPMKLPKSNTEIVLSPKSYAQLFKDLGSRANIKIKAKPLEKRPAEKGCLMSEYYTDKNGFTARVGEDWNDEKSDQTLAYLTSPRTKFSKEEATKKFKSYWTKK